MTDSSELEMRIAIAKMRIKSSIHSELQITKEAYDIPEANFHVAYACFEILVEMGRATGRENDWYEFLQGGLKEVIWNVQKKDKI